jgi:hypothetical protein
LLLTLLTACAPEAPEPQQAAPAAPPQPEPNEAAAIAALREVNRAQTDFIRRNRRYALEYDELKSQFFLNEEPTVAKTGYQIRLRPAPDAGSYTVVAAPANTASPARRFFTDQTGVIRAESGSDATAASPEITE